MDPALLVADYLNGLDIGARAYLDVPDTRPTSLDPPEPFLVLEHTGARQSDPVLSEQSVDVDCWAATRAGAADLASRVVDALMRASERLPDVFHVDIDSTYNNPDLESGTPRVTVGATLTVNQ